MCNIIRVAMLFVRAVVIPASSIFVAAMFLTSGLTAVFRGPLFFQVTISII